MEKPNPQRVVAGRFGLGLAAGETLPASDPRGFVEAQLAPAPRPPAPKLNGTREQITAGLERRAVLREVKRQVAESGKAAQGPDMAEARREALSDAPKLTTAADELDHWLTGTLKTRMPLQERLILHWSNHFTVSATGGKANTTAGPFQREAIHPHILGNFHDFLVAVVTHPAMLAYLDNVNSVGPDSRVGKGRGFGLNENLAREILELHTLGSTGGYAQADVTAFAAVLTGWRVDMNADSGTAGETIFEPRRHQPGPKVILGKTYPEGGRDELFAVLRDLAAHPATARNVATRLARAFVSDPPPPGLVTALERSFRSTNGDLKALAATLVRADESWDTPPVKLRPPIEFIAMTARLLGELPRPPRANAALVAMGQPYLGAPSPKGWSEENDAWATSDGIKTRLDWCQEISTRHAGKLDIKGLVNGPLRPLLSDESRTTVLQGESREQALTLLLMSPDFQRR